MLAEIHLNMSLGRYRLGKNYVCGMKSFARNCHVQKVKVTKYDKLDTSHLCFRTNSLFRHIPGALFGNGGFFSMIFASVTSVLTFVSKSWILSAKNFLVFSSAPCRLLKMSINSSHS